MAVLAWQSQLTPRNIIKPKDDVVSSANRPSSMKAPRCAAAMDTLLPRDMFVGLWQVER